MDRIIIIAIITKKITRKSSLVHAQLEVVDAVTPLANAKLKINHRNVQKRF